MKRLALVPIIMVCTLSTQAQKKKRPSPESLKELAYIIVNQFERSVKAAGECTLGNPKDMLERFAPGAHIEVSNVNTGEKKRWIPSEYFNRLHKRICAPGKIYNDAQFDYEPVNVYAKTNVITNGDTYRFTIRVDQEFSGTGKNGLNYCDITMKEIIIDFTNTNNVASPGKIIDVKVTKTLRCEDK